MLRTPIYILTVKTIKFHRNDSYPNYNPDNLLHYVHVNEILSIYLSFEEAEARKDKLINEMREGTALIFNVVIDEYQDGSIITEELPNERWIYDANGEVIDLLHNIHSVLTSSSVLEPYSKGDIIEILTPDSTLQLGIILEVPSYSPTESAGKNSYANKYTILTGPYYDDILNFGLSQIRHYKRSDENVNFMRDYYTNYPDKLLSHDE